MSETTTIWCIDCGTLDVYQNFPRCRPCLRSTWTPTVKQIVDDVARIYGQ